MHRRAPGRTNISKEAKESEHAWKVQTDLIYILERKPEEGGFLEGEDGHNIQSYPMKWLVFYTF